MFSNVSVYVGVFFFKQKTAYYMRISDWSSDVCSSDLEKPMTSGDVNELGFDESRLQRVTDTLTQQINSGYIHGAMMRVSRRGQIVVDFMDGYAEKASGRRLERDSVFVTMSVAKPFTSVLILSQIGRAHV